MAFCKARVSLAESTAIYHFIAVKYIDILPTLVTIIGNAICLLTFIKTSSLHSPSNLLVGALCLCDFIVGIIIQPLFFATIIALQTNSHAFEILWEATEIAVVLGGGASTFTAYIVTIDRYLAICYPFRYYNIVTIKRYMLMLSIGFLSSIPGAITVYFDKQTYIYGIAVIVMILLQVVLFYALIYRAVRHQRNRVTVIGTIEGEDRNALRRSKEDQDKAYTIGIILLLFFLSYIPCLVVATKLSLTGNDVCQLKEDDLIAHLWGQFLLLLGSSFNPIVYSLRSREFRRATKRLFLRNYLLSRFISTNTNSAAANGSRRHITDSSQHNNPTV